MLAVISAILFALSVPLSKILVYKQSPNFLAGFFYISSAFGLFIYRFFVKSKEEKISRIDLPYLILMVISGGFLAPYLLMKGLYYAESSNVSLILNFEVVFSVVFSVILLKEDSDIKLWTSVILLFIACIMISYNVNSKLYFNKGSIFVMLASLLWAFDNNMTGKLSLKDPVYIAVIKGFFGGIMNLAISFREVSAVNFSVNVILSSFLIGVFCYGASLVLLIYSMRRIGVNLSSVLFGTYPFIAFFLSFLILNESLSLYKVFSLLLALVSVFLLYTRKHEHFHSHKITHSHLHSHDEHHDHHKEPDKKLETHTHIHTHNLNHLHPHTSDGHHKHH